MFIDEIQLMLEREESLKRFGGNSSVEAEAQYENLRQQLLLLDRTCPRYDVYNVYSTLFPTLIKSESPLALKRNANATSKRDQLVAIAGKAPLGPPWSAFCLEYRANENQRAAYLVRWNSASRRYVCTVMFDSLRGKDMVEFLPNAFEMLLDEDDNFEASVVDANLRGYNLQCAKNGVGLVRTCIELLNWDREDVPTQVLVNPKAEKDSAPKNGVIKSAPTIIKFEPFLKTVLTGTHRGSCDGRTAPGQHLVRGHYQNFKFTNPRFGHKPVLGKTYGRLWVKPCKRGNPERGAMKAPRSVFTLNGIDSQCVELVS